MNDEPPIKRAGISVDEKGSAGFLPFWPDSFAAASPTSWIGRLSAERQKLIAIAQKRHEQNEMVRNARVKNQTPTLPEAETRVRSARAEQKQVGAIHHITAQIADAVFVRKMELKKSMLDIGDAGLPAIMSDQEMRTALRSMDDKQRSAAMQDARFRMAALRAPAVLSGLAESMHQHLIQLEMETRFPADMAQLADGEAAVELTRETAQVVTRAVENELHAVNAPIAEPAAPKRTSPAWA